MVESRSVSGDRGSLARKSSREKIDARRTAIHRSHVLVDRHSGPSHRQDGAAVGFGLAEEGVFPSGESEAVVEESVT
jgi:hypothetical protein